MHQELDADGLAYPWAKVHSLINPRLAVGSLMVDGLEDVAVTIGDVSILPGEIDAEAGVTVQCQKLSVAFAGTGPNC
jgi:hypothetical protein